MKLSQTFLYVALALFLFVSIASANTARLQVIHNSPDPAASQVDIYLNDKKLLDDFAFRAASPFIDAPAGVEFTVGVAPGTSASVDDVIASFDFTLQANETYVAIASGVLDPSTFAANPDGVATGFEILVKAMARESAMDASSVEFFALHGSPDAPTVDVIARDVATLVDDAPYTAMTDYLAVPPASYLLDVTPGMDNETIVATFQADLSGLAGGAAVVFASGFLNPADNQNGPAFGLFAALPDGNVVEFPAITTARLQVIHNAADPAAAVVDIYANEELLIPNFEFRAATPFIDAPANVDLNIGVAPGGSSGASDIIATLPPVKLKPGETYVAIANGVLNPGDFAANPDGRDTAFQLFVKAMAREQAMDMAAVEFFAFHGATDAPTVDVIARDVATLVDNAAYGDITDYLSVPPASYTLDVTPGNDNETIVASYTADLSGLAGGAAVVFASGFLTPDASQDGAAFGLFAALPTGDVVAFEPITTARLQVIHNSADPAARSVDIYVNEQLLIPDFRFRKATPYIDVPAAAGLNIGVAPDHSEGPEDIIATLPTITLKPGGTYVAIANGVLNPDKFAANPDGRNTAFQLFINDMAKETSMDENNTDLFIFHGVTDAPKVDIIDRMDGKAADDAGYGDMTGYLSLKSNTFRNIDVQLADNSVTVTSHKSGFYTHGGESAVIFASGFLSPTDNLNGQGFGLFIAYPDGRVDTLPILDTARLQVIHNSADPAAALVDIYVNEALLIPDFAFRSATPFIDVPANTDLAVGVAPAGSAGPEDIILSLDAISLLGGNTYVAVASGVVGDDFAPNPDGKDISFGLKAFDMAREQAQWVKFVELVVLHGATDAPAVDVLVNGQVTLVENLSYGMFTDYLRVEPDMYRLDITPAGMPETVVASFDADVTGLQGGAGVVFASGFLSPADNSNGEAFGLFVALPTGDVVELPAASGALALSKFTGVEDEISAPTEFNLSQNYPNPFNPSTNISFSLPESQFVTLKIYDVMGREVATLVENEMTAGSHDLSFNAASLASGKYFYRLTAGDFTATKQMVLLK